MISGFYFSRMYLHFDIAKAKYIFFVLVALEYIKNTAQQLNQDKTHQYSLFSGMYQPSLVMQTVKRQFGTLRAGCKNNLQLCSLLALC